MRDRFRGIAESSTAGLLEVVDELRELGYVADVETEVRNFGAPSPLKVCLVNGVLFAGLYQLAPRTLNNDGERVDVIDMMGKDTTMIRYVDSGADPIARAMIRQTTDWFESVWGIVDRPAND